MPVKPKLKIALVHDYLKEFGGAESVLEVLSDIFPDAPIYTTLYTPKYFGPHRSRLEKKWQGRIHQSFFRLIPFASRLISPLRLFSPLAFKSFDFSGFDLIITSATGAYFPNSLNKKQAQLICYCHTPPRYLYGLPTARNFTRNRLVFILMKLANHFLRLLDFRSAQNVDQFIANSKTTALRIQKFYRKQALIINPPVKLPSSLVPRSSNTPSTKPYYLTGGRLARAKRYDVAIQACNLLRAPLKVFGRDFAGFQSELEALAGPTVEFLGEVTDQQKADLYRNAKAFIFCSDNEDFGIIPVESMAYGCPVVAYKSGGVAETVIDGRTGIFFNQLSSASCAEAIKRLNHTEISPQNCFSRAALFSTKFFSQQISDLVNNSIKQYPQPQKTI